MCIYTDRSWIEETLVKSILLGEKARKEKGKEARSYSYSGLMMGMSDFGKLGGDETSPERISFVGFGSFIERSSFIVV